jgi:hypothetical protein
VGKLAVLYYSPIIKSNDIKEDAMGEACSAQIACDFQIAF